MVGQTMLLTAKAQLKIRINEDGPRKTDRVVLALSVGSFDFRQARSRD